jgi:hypothetical protein
MYYVCIYVCTYVCISAFKIIVTSLRFNHNRNITTHFSKTSQYETVSELTQSFCLLQRKGRDRHTLRSQQEHFLTFYASINANIFKNIQRGLIPRNPFNLWVLESVGCSVCLNKVNQCILSIQITLIILLNFHSFVISFELEKDKSPRISWKLKSTEGKEIHFTADFHKYRSFFKKSLLRD